MIVNSFCRSGSVVFLIVICLFLLAGCVEVEVDPEPPYPLHPYDYNYPEDEKQPPPWEHPEDFPAIRIMQPTNGDFIDSGMVTVSGTYNGPDMLTLKLGDQDLTLSGNTFSAQVNVGSTDALVPITVTATTKDFIVASDAVTVIVGDSAEVDSLVPSALMLDVENDGFAAISGFLSTILDDLDLTGEVARRTDRAAFEVTTARIGNVDLDMASEDEGLGLDLLISGVEIVLEVLGSEISLRIDGFFASTLTALSVTEDNKLAIEIVESSISIAQWSTDLPLIPDFLEDLLDTLVELLLPAILEGLVEGALADTINNLLAGLDIAITSDTFVYSLLPALVETSERNLVLSLDTQAEPLEGFNDDFQGGSFRVTHSVPPVFEELTPSTESTYGLGLGLNDDMLNQLMFLTCASGLLNLELSDPMITAELFSVLFFSFEDIDPDMQIMLEFSPTTAPVFWGNTEEQTVVMTLAGYQARILVDRGEQGNWEAMTFGVDISAPISVQINADNSISLKLSDVEFGLRILHNGVGQKNVANMTRMLTELFESVLPEILSQIEDDLTIQLPEILGLKISLADITLFGSGEDYLGVFLDLEYPS